MNNWKKVKLSEIGKIVGGATPSTKEPLNYENGTIPWLTPKDLTGFDSRYIKRGERNITQLGYESCSTKLLPENSILFTSRAPIGYIAIAENEICTNQGFKSIIPNDDMNPLFIYYLLKYYTPLIKQNGNGSTFKEVSGKIMSNIEVKIPENKKIQDKIVSILDPIDKQIEVLNEISRQLEKIIKILYFRLIEESSKFSPISIKDLPLIVTDYVANGSFKSLKENVTLYDTENFAYFIRNTDLKSNAFNTFVDKHSYDFLKKSNLNGGEIIISNVGDVGKVYLCPKLSKPMTLGNNLITVKTDNDSLRLFLYLWFKYGKGKAQIESIKSGSVQEKFNKTNFRNLIIDLPEDDKLTDFYQKIIDLFNETENIYQSIKKLTELKNQLLPNLISGEIDVSELDIET